MDRAQSNHIKSLPKKYLYFNFSFRVFFAGSGIIKQVWFANISLVIVKTIYVIKSFLKCMIGSVSDEQIVIQERDTSTVIIDGDCLIN